MIFATTFKSYPARHALRVGMAVFIAVIISYYYSFSQAHWLVLAAFLMSHTERGAPIQQSFSIFLTLLIALLLSSLLSLGFNALVLLASVIFVLFVIIGTFLFVKQPALSKTFYLCISFMLILLLSMLGPLPGENAIRNRFLDVVIGAAIGMLCTQLLFSEPLARLFRQSLSSILNTIIEFVGAMDECLVKKTDMTLVNKQKDLLEKNLEDPNTYPEWVYAYGFNPGLRSGFRFFLINLEQVIEICFSLQYLLKKNNDMPSFLAITNQINDAMQRNLELLEMLLVYFVTDKIKNTDANFTSDITALENALHQVIPESLELLDISPEYVSVTAFVRNVTDLRHLLLKLIMAL